MRFGAASKGSDRGSPESPAWRGQSLAVNKPGSTFQWYHLSPEGLYSLHGTNKLWERLNEVQSACHTPGAQ